ncbi:MAG: MFS transporter [Synergistaceae bacterium]|nr:MFS transporter [Synergistaceae bacterium]
MKYDKTLLGLNISVFLMMIGVGMIVALLPQKIIALDGHGRNVGYLASMFAISYIVLQIPIGALADKYGFKKFLILLRRKRAPRRQTRGIFRHIRYR